MLKKILGCLFLSVFFFGTVLGLSWDDVEDGSPSDVVGEMQEETKDKVNNDKDFTAVDDMKETSGVKETLKELSKQIWAYIQWIMYIGMTAWVILIIYNGMRLVLNPNKEEESGKVKTRMMYIGWGVFIMLTVSIIIELVVKVIDTVGF